MILGSRHAEGDKSGKSDSDDNSGATQLDAATIGEATPLGSDEWGDALSRFLDQWIWGRSHAEDRVAREGL